MLFGDINSNMSIRALIQRAFMEVVGPDTPSPLYSKFVEIMNQDGKYTQDQFRKPMIDAWIRRDYTAAKSLAQLCLLNVAWLDLKDRQAGWAIEQEIEKQLKIRLTDKIDILPIAASNMSEYPQMRLMLNNLIKDGWLVHIGNVKVEGFGLAVFQTATAPLRKRYNQNPDVLAKES